MAVQVLDDFLSQHFGALAAHGRCSVRRFAVPERARQERHRRLRFLDRIRHHTHSMEAQGIRKDERTSSGIRQEGREHRAVQTGELGADLPRVPTLSEGGVEHEVVVPSLPRYPQGMGGQE